MRVVLDIETERLENPQRIHLICCQDLDTGEVHVFREQDLEAFKSFANRIIFVSGHNLLKFDLPVINRILSIYFDVSRVLDTLVLSRLVNFDIVGGHSLGAWGERLGIAKKFSDVDQEFFREYSPELEERCLSDVSINVALFRHLEKYYNSPVWQAAIQVEQELASDTQEMSDIGFAYDLPKAKLVYSNLTRRLKELDDKIRISFPKKLKLIREVIPRITLYSTIAKNSIPKALGTDLSFYSPDAPFSFCEWVEFNPGSPKQIVERLNEAGWKPTSKTKGYKDFLKSRISDPEKLAHYETYGWKVDDENLQTLPKDAPEGAHLLATRLMIASRISKLDEQLSACRPHYPLDGPEKAIQAFSGEGSYPSSPAVWKSLPEVPECEYGVPPLEWRIHGEFNGIGAWTGRMSHYRPNTANIPTRKPQDTDEIASINDILRTLWIAGKGRLLIGVDADQIQLRILAHYMQDQEFIQALVNGDKEKGTDVHSLNVKAIGPACKGRRDSKTFIYSWLLGAGVGRVAEILGCNYAEAKDARSRFIEYYPGLRRVKNVDIPRDARRGYFQGLDGRYVKIVGEDYDQKRHFTLAGYLQNGEKVVMAHARKLWKDKLRKERIPAWLVGFIHDEWQIETVNDMDTAKYVSRTAADSLYTAGVNLGTLCPMKGSILNGHDVLAIGNNWLETH